MLARAREDELARLVVVGLELVVLRRAAERLAEEERDRRQHVAGARPRDAGARRAAEAEARRDADAAEANLRDVAVERAGVERVGRDDVLDRCRRTQRAQKALVAGVDGDVVQL